MSVVELVFEMSVRKNVRSLLLNVRAKSRQAGHMSDQAKKIISSPEVSTGWLPNSYRNAGQGRCKLCWAPPVCDTCTFSYTQSTCINMARTIRQHKTELNYSLLKTNENKYPGPREIQHSRPGTSRSANAHSIATQDMDNSINNLEGKGEEGTEAVVHNLPHDKHADQWEAGFAQILPSQIPKLFQNFSKTFSKTHSHPRTDLTEQNNPQTPMASLQGRTCTVQCVPFDSEFQEVQNFPTQTPNSILFQGLELSFQISKTFPKFPKPVRTL